MGPGLSAMNPHTVDLVGLAHAAMRERGLEPEFPADVLAQASRLEAPADESRLTDLRHLAWCSIDNDDSRDLDQLSVAERTGAGARVLVAIADVDALVPRGTRIDTHAAINTTSVCTPMRVFPMLPVRLSTDLTSLNPDVDRIAMVVSFEVDRQGSVRDGTVTQALVRNHARLSYDDVAAWLEGHVTVPAPIASRAGMADQLRLQDEAATWLRVRRHHDGALDLRGSDARAVVVDGRVVGLRADEKNRAQALIEDVMIAVNGVSARYLEQRGLASIRRVVRTPKRWDRLQAIAAEIGERLPDAPDPAALSAFLAKRRAAEPERYGELSLAVLKLLGRGEYVLTRPADTDAGHFGLAVREYAHSTAPNRRYPDLITQRLLKAAASGTAGPYADEELDALARHCTMQEDAADKVERQMRKTVTALVLSSRLGEVFEGVVTGASSKGTWVRTFDPPAEGRIVRETTGLDVGQRVRVRLTATDVERGFLDFAPVE